MDVFWVREELVRFVEEGREIVAIQLLHKDVRGRGQRGVGPRTSTQRLVFFVIHADQVDRAINAVVDLIVVNVRDEARMNKSCQFLQ